MQYQLQIFEYQNHQNVRTVEIDGEIWFVARDVCAALSIEHVGSALRGLDEDEKGVHNMHTPGGIQEMAIISESGLYGLIFRSRNADAHKFRKWVTHEVLPTLRRTGTFSMAAARNTPIFVRRYNDNWDRVSTGYFSVISELFIRVYGRFEHIGYVMPDKGDTGKEMRPDISVGQTFPRWLEERHPHLADKFTMYQHILPEGKMVEARQYEMAVLAVFIEFVDTVWLPEYGPDYFKKRDRRALDYLPKLLPSPKKKAG